MSRQTRLALIAVTALVVVASCSGNSAKSPTQSTVGDTQNQAGAEKPPSQSTLATKRPSGTVIADTSSRSGQSPSSGTCAHWSQRFVNRSDTRVVRISFAPAGALYSSGTKGAPGYRTWPAETPPAADLSVSIPPGGAQALQLQTCTATAPPAGATSLVIQAPEQLRWEWQGGTTGSGKFHP
jgi:hypothetical protein